jgi:hypothetical protein
LPRRITTHDTNPSAVTGPPVNNNKSARFPLGHDAFEAHLAGVPEDSLTVVVLDVFVKPQAGASLGQDRCKRGFADL